MNERIRVWRDAYDTYEQVGTIVADEDRVSFGYDRGYAGPAVSVRLPVRAEPFSERDTEVFFSALIPEGQTRIDFLDALRAGRSEYAPILERLNDESSGALVFTVGDEEPGKNEHYEPIGSQLFEDLANSPHATAVETVGKTRLSLAGAMAKIGLYRDGSSSWYLPHGSAPSTHIIKAGDDRRFPFEILNEAICLETARACGLPTEDFDLIPTENGPLLAVRRFDRIEPDAPRFIGGHLRPMRLHQEDLCQVGGTKLKYEPSGGDFLSFAVSHVSSACESAFGEAMLVLYYVFFDYLMGNCDNHLKNISLLYTADWRMREVAPLYDVIDTTVYESLKDTMGISLSSSRSIFEVTREDVEASVRGTGMPVDLAMREFDSLVEEVLANFHPACERVANRGFPEVERLAAAMRHGIECRAAFKFSESGRICIA